MRIRPARKEPRTLPTVLMRQTAFSALIRDFSGQRVTSRAERDDNGINSTQLVLNATYRHWHTCCSSVGRSPSNRSKTQRWSDILPGQIWFPIGSTSPWPREIFSKAPILEEEIAEPGTLVTLFPSNYQQ